MDRVAFEPDLVVGLIWTSELEEEMPGEGPARAKGPTPVLYHQHPMPRRLGRDPSSARLPRG